MYIDLPEKFRKGRKFRKALKIKGAAADTGYLRKDFAALHGGDVRLYLVDLVDAIFQSALVLSVYAELVKLAVLPFRKGAPDLNVLKSFQNAVKTLAFGRLGELTHIVVIIVCILPHYLVCLYAVLLKSVQNPLPKGGFLGVTRDDRQKAKKAKSKIPLRVINTFLFITASFVGIAYIL